MAAAEGSRISRLTACLDRLSLSRPRISGQRANAAAAAAVLNIWELVEGILLHLHRKDLARATGTARVWYNVSKQSPQVRKIHDSIMKAPLDKTKLWINQGLDIEHVGASGEKFRPNKINPIYEADFVSNEWYRCARRCLENKTPDVLLRDGFEVTRLVFRLWSGDEINKSRVLTRFTTTPPVPAMTLQVRLWRPRADAELIFIPCTVYAVGGVTFGHVVDVAEKVANCNLTYVKKKNTAEMLENKYLWVEARVDGVRKMSQGEDTSKSLSSGTDWYRYLALR